MSGQVHQTLHGYERGHRLLASSMELPNSVARKLLYLSDLSGANRAEGFEQYLTGFPIPEGVIYALARTWEAPEMERPGCVFTHTLLISFSDLAQLTDLSVLLTLLSRPQKGVYAAYRNSLALPTIGTQIQPNQSQLSALIEALYAGDPSNIAIAANSSETWQPAIFAVWSQMWPRLRRSLTFSTGSLGPRTLDGESFAIQVIPARWQTRLSREFPDSTFIEPQPVPADNDNWQSLLIIDCTCPDPMGLRQFLRYYAADLEPRRALMQPLLELWRWRHLPTDKQAETGRVQALLQLMGETFPEAEEAARLKRELFGKPGDGMRPSLEAAILYGLSTIGSDAAYDFKALACAERIVALWQNERPTAESLLEKLLNTKRNPLGERLLDTIGDALSLAEVSKLATTHLVLLSRWLPQHPQWLSCATLWDQPLERQRGLLDLLYTSRKQLSDELPQILRTLITTGSLQLTRVVAETFRDELVEILLKSWTHEQTPVPVPVAWSDLLRRHQEVLGSCLLHEPRSPRLIELLVPLLDPAGDTVSRLPLDLWGTDVLQAAKQASDSNKSILHALRCQLGLRNFRSRGYLLLEDSFVFIYRAIDRNQLADHPRQLLLLHLPERRGKMRLANDGDRLLQALWRCFDKERWALSYLFRILDEPDVFRSFVGSLRFYEEADAIKSLRRFSRQHPYDLTALQRDLLNESSLKEMLKKLLRKDLEDED